jgi:hypothetical protein
MRHFLLVAALVAGTAVPAGAQECPGVRLAHERDIPARCSGVTLTMRHDARDRPFLYVASKEAGLKIYRLGAAPVLVGTIAGAAIDSLDVMSLSQSGDYLYLALGNHFVSGEHPGLAIVDVRNPARASVLAFWTDTTLNTGAGIVESDGDRVYLGAMRDGLLIFDVADKRKPVLLSRLVPEITYPDARPDPRKYNARGLVVRGTRVYLSYDAGGVRIIDAADPRRPREIGRYANPALNRKPRAYNNAVLDGDLLYVAVDYCGVEVLDVSDPSRIRLVSWWNPWTCETSPLRWFASDGHANELAYDSDRKLLFVATGKSDLHVLSMADPRAPVLCETYGGTANGIGTWGVSIHKARIFLAYICTLGSPFPSRWTGVKILTYK